MHRQKSWTYGSSGERAGHGYKEPPALSRLRMQWASSLFGRGRDNIACSRQTKLGKSRAKGPLSGAGMQDKTHQQETQDIGRRF